MLDLELVGMYKSHMVVTRGSTAQPRVLKPGGPTLF